MDAFEVTLDGRVHRFFPGATVRDLMGRLEPSDQVAIANGLAYFTDQQGDRLGESGSLRPGGAYFLYRRL